ncbi:hypothetical protein [Halostagnicola bangensis]
MSVQDEVDGLPLKQGAIVGAGTFVVGYIATFVLATIDSEIELGEEESTFEMIGLLFYNAQFVDMELSGLNGTETFNILSEESTQIPELVFNLVPIVLLVAGGYVLATRVLETRQANEGGAKLGASIVVGYLPLAFLGTILFEETAEGGLFGGSVTLAPETLPAIVLAGILLPLAFGAIGGYLAQR